MTRGILTGLMLSAIVAGSIGPAAGAGRAHRRRAAAIAPTTATRTARPSMFYPQEVEGGVSGNLPFNNQIRKHTDPLNANGGR